MRFKKSFPDNGMEEGSLGFLLCYIYYIHKVNNSELKIAYNKYIVITSPFASFLLFLLHVSFSCWGPGYFWCLWAQYFFRARSC